jgi:lipoprotein-anchoring transpeptidase ErfK/SrfK
MTQLTRRGFLRSAALASVGLAAQGSLQAMAQTGTPTPAPAPPPVTHWDGSPLGRVLLNYMTEYKEPSWKAAVSGKYYYWNNIVGIKQAVGGEGLYPTNHTWLQTETGYIYSSWVQPVSHIDTNPAVAIGEGGLWGQITVPMTDARSGPSDDSYRRHTMYYSTVNRIMAMENGYYKFSEIYGYEYWVKAAHVRIVTPEELAPLSPQVPADQKRIEISTHEQRLYAYEGETVVFSANVSTGSLTHPTPVGTYAVLDKRHGQRMTGGVGDGGYNLPGIPFICYFNSNWVATHGCYWHNDYGRRHSNGCINLMPEAAKWIFRWTTPVANYYDFRTTANAAAGQPGTKVIVRY